VTPARGFIALLKIQTSLMKNSGNGANTSIGTALAVALANLQGMLS